MHYKSKNPYTKGTNRWYIRRFFLRNQLNIIVYSIIVIAIVLTYKAVTVPPEASAPPMHMYQYTLPTLVELDPYVPTHIERPDIEPPIHEVHATTPYTEEDVVILACILQAECWEGDWRKEATVIVNILEHRTHEFYNPDGTIKGVIEARNGAAFNGSRTKDYKNRVYTDYAYQVAYEVLIEGYRSWDGDPTMLYFSNLETATDIDFIESINWVEKQTNGRSHSFGKDY